MTKVLYGLVLATAVIVLFLIAAQVAEQVQTVIDQWGAK
jgi:hypothetical protein